MTATPRKDRRLLAGDEDRRRPTNTESYGRNTGGGTNTSGSRYDKHGNDSLFYTAVEKDFLINVLWHFFFFLALFGIRLPVTVEFS